MKHTRELVSCMQICTCVQLTRDLFCLFYFSYFVQENEDEGFIVGEVFAEDIDSGVFGEVMYSISGLGSQK